MFQRRKNEMMFGYLQKNQYVNQTHKKHFKVLRLKLRCRSGKFLHMQFRQQRFLLCWLTQEVQLKLIEQQLVYAIDRTKKREKPRGQISAFRCIYMPWLRDFPAAAFHLVFFNSCVCQEKFYFKVLNFFVSIFFIIA